MQLKFSDFLHRQIPILVVLSLFPGLGYLFLGWLAGIYQPALVWYILNLLVSAWGIALYRAYDPERMGQRQLDRWYRHVNGFVYVFFGLWALIFVLYVRESASNLHYIAIFTQIGATTVAAAFLYPVPRLFKPIVPFMMAFLVVYFALIGEWYGYVLAIFASILAWVLFHAAHSSHQLLLTTYRQATHDLLTNLANRQYFLQRLQRVMGDLKSSGGYSYLLLIDLDHFKTVNDSLGHGVGDGLLEVVASRLKRVAAGTQCVARLGGDEFIVIGEDFSDGEQCRIGALNRAEQLLGSLKQHYLIGEHQIYISASIGVRLFSAEEDDYTRLVREADIAMYEAKSSGRDGVFLFSAEVATRVEQHLAIERRLHFALKRQEIYLVYQPVLDRQARIVGAECLVRWKNPELGQVAPEAFVPIAEQTGLIIKLGEHILSTAFNTLNHWEQEGILLRQLSINISVRQLMHPDFVNRVAELIERLLDQSLVSKLVFEITETVLSDEIARVIQVLNTLRSMGIRFSMDDFGTGYSSLSYLKQLPVEELKIDRSFITHLNQDQDNQAMVNTILNIAEIQHLTVVAEGIESGDDFEFLKTRNCHYFQGYHFSAPLLRDEFESFYRHRQRL